jgi:hypothetical protein
MCAWIPIPMMTGTIRPISEKLTKNVATPLQHF